MRRSRLRMIPLLVTVAVASTLLLSAPVQAVVPIWTTLIPQADGGFAMGIVSHDGGQYVLMRGYDGHDVCRLARVDATGQVSWIRDIAVGGLDCPAVAGDETGLYVSINVIGRLDGVSGGDGWDAVVRKLDYDGNELWTRAFSTPDSELGWSIAATGDGVVLGGSTFGPAFEHDAFMRRYDADGNLGWTRFVRTDRNETVTELAAGASGIYAGISYVDDTEATVVRFGLDGNVGWTWSLGTIPAETGGMVVDGDRLIVAGTTSFLLPDGIDPSGPRTVFLASVDAATGDPVWLRQFGGTDLGAYAEDVTAGPEGLYVAGYTAGSLPRFENHGHDDAFVRAYGVNGHRRWTRQFGTHREDIAYGVTADATGVVTMGTTSGNLGSGRVEGLATFVRRWEPA
jgi:hypothetical protein